MRCLCCGKVLPSNRSESGWHTSCIRRFFGTKALPEIQLNEETLLALAARSVAKGYTVTGVQKKMSLHLTKDDRPRLTLVGYPSGYILKPQETDYPHMPEAEHLTMCMAEAAGISAVPHALIRENDGIAYITRRIDRPEPGKDLSWALAMEDFCQLDHKPTEEKYLGSYERSAKIISRYSDRAGLDLTELYLRLVFCFLTGNSDMHLKNFSLIETRARSGHYQLAPAYDLLPVQLFLTNDPEDTALALNGKKQHLRRKDFLAFAANAGISAKAAGAMIGRMLGFIPKWQELCRGSLLPPPMQDQLLALISSRAQRLAL